MQEQQPQGHTDPRESVRFFLRPMGNPLPLGFVGLAGGTFALTSLQLQWVSPAHSLQVALAVVLVAVPLQFLASVMGFLARDPVSGTGMGTLAVAWLTIGALIVATPNGSRTVVLGLMLFYLAAAVLISALIAMLGKAVAGVVLTISAMRFVLTGIYECVGGAGWRTAAGWVGLLLCVVALYAVLAFELESIRRATVLPTLRHGAGRTALDGHDLNPVGPVERDAGVRQQL